MFLKRMLNRSIATRTIILISSITIIIVFFMTLSIFISLQHNFDKIANDFMNSEVTVLRNLLGQPDSYLHDLYQEIILEPASNKYSYLAKVSSAGKTIIQTHSFARRFKHVKWPTPNTNSLSRIIYYTHKGKHYALASTQITTAKPKPTTFNIELAYNTTIYDKVLNRFASTLYIIIFIGILILILSLLVATKISLWPLNALSKKISSINPHNLDLQLVVDEAPSELQPVVASFNNLLRRIKAVLDKSKAFSANIAHELRTPINNLMLQAELLQDKDPNDVDINSIFSENLEEYAKLSSIIDRLLFLAKHDEEYTSPNKVKLSCKEEIDKVVDFHKAYAEEKNISISVNGDDASILADKALFRNAIANILTNAIKYNQQNGNVAVTVANDDGYITITVADTGPGVPLEALNRLTERFYRVDTHDKSSTAGSGLGLAIVKAIVDIHHGFLKFENNTPHGLITIIKLPK